MSSRSPTIDRWPILLGGAGCGCGTSLVILALVVLVVASASGDVAAAKPDSSRPDIIITVQDAFIQQMMARSVPGDVLKDVVVNIQPGGVVAIQGRIEATLLGQTVSLPFSLSMRLVVQAGRLRADVNDVQVSTDEALSAVVRQFLSGLGDQVSQAINAQVLAGLGDNASIMDVTTEDRHLVIRARWTSP